MMHLSDGVVGLGHAFSEVCGLSSPAGPAGGGPAFCDGEAVQGGSRRQDVIDSLCCGLKDKQNGVFRHQLKMLKDGHNIKMSTINVLDSLV